MSGIKNIINLLNGTFEATILQTIDTSYNKIKNEQSEWYEKSHFVCQKDCGECCRNFEPDLLECEAIYMAAWILDNQPDIADAVCNNQYPFSENKGCPFWNEQNPLHCTIYEGRPFICRLFGACGNKGKDNSIVFKPCKFYLEENLKKINPLLEHKQYSQAETESIFSALPPIMSDFMEEAIAINPDNIETKLLREILPETIRRLKWICDMNKNASL